MKLLIGMLIIACLAPLFLKGPDGGPIMTLDDWKIDLPTSIRELMAGMGKKESATEPQAPAEIYKWQDADGQWQFSNTPPDETAELVEISDINLMGAYVPPPEPDAVIAAGASLPTSGAMTATPDQVKQMMETVTNLQETMDDRKADLDVVVGGDG